MKINIEYQDIDEMEIYIKSREHDEKLTALLKYLNSSDNKFVGFINEEFYILNLKEIIYFTILDGKVYAIDFKQKYLMKYRLYEIEEKLKSNNDFVKINQSSIANVKMIEKFSLCFNGTIDVYYKNKDRDYVSRRCVANLKKRYEI